MVDKSAVFYGGGRWIRTTEGSASRFTVCPLWPLGNSPIFSSANSVFSQIKAKQSGFDLKRKKEGADTQFAAPAENEVKRVSSDVVELVDGLEPPTC